MNGKSKLETVAGVILLIISGAVFMSFKLAREPLDSVVAIILVIMSALGTIMLTFGVKGFVNDAKRPPGTGYT